MRELSAYVMEHIFQTAVGATDGETLADGSRRRNRDTCKGEVHPRNYFHGQYMCRTISCKLRAAQKRKTRGAKASLQGRGTGSPNNRHRFVMYWRIMPPFQESPTQTRRRRLLGVRGY